MGKLKAAPKNKEALDALKNLSQEKPRAKPSSSEYDNFNQMDGQHPWQEVMPEGQISYKARQLKSGKVAYFNFSLAKEMGLIHKDHPERLNKNLENKLNETFSIRIINEYDIKNKIYHPIANLLSSFCFLLQ